MSPDNSSPIRVLVVDDSFFMRKVIVNILQSDVEIQIVGQASDGNEALELINSLKPDVVTLDLVMPGIDGLATLKQIMERDDAPAVLIVSAHSSADAEATLDCLAAGAVDFVLKPSDTDAWGLDKVAPELRSKVRAAAMAAHGLRESHSHSRLVDEAKIKRRYKIVVIGSSTGGPVALERLVPRLPEGLGCPVVIAQHMPAEFVETLVTRLAKMSSANVVLGNSGDQLAPGTVYFCQGGHNTELVRAGDNVRLFVQPSTEVLTPSVDTLFSSAARVYKDGVLAVVLTGMGQDGMEGSRSIKDNGGSVLVESKETALIYGMGRAVAEADLADSVLPLNAITERLRGAASG